ncbi:MAG TPA: hypothetical protein VFA06_03025 [Actinocrinis sp.]|uniref:hypothetical protein n=1 Tax=Actinocrinis sp. TaxID=1920516 RepID=UPI002D624288|nr:hypothetical protein [Actinocrinis sp.]HZU54821.1 hypothetical protein [Actinocrinis sp.]
MALDKVIAPTTDRPEFGEDAFQIPGDPPYQAWFSPPAEAGVRGKRVSNDRVAEAAQVYAEALAAGSNAPGEAVAKALGYSRATAARRIRAARERGLLPPLGQERESAAAPRLRGLTGRTILVDLSEFEAAAAEGRKRLEAEQEAEREATQRRLQAERAREQDRSE